ncbi:MAG: type II/IV secretion system ATPase subunit [Nitrososphaerota archaeon]|nr:type II/IV secretion system ATPase subunit [Nitrososphaerota archaeon]MDG7023726.1 type II/IV secretion system ATPase subunit [Nitrososphaerota archaeon]
MKGFSWPRRHPEPKPVQEPQSPEQPTPRTAPPLAVEGRIVDSYRVPNNGDPDSSAEVIIVERDSFGQYLLRLPPLEEKQKQALTLLKSNLRSSIPVEVPGNPRQVLEKYLWETAEKAGLLSIVQEAHNKFLYHIMKDFAGFWEIDPLVNDDSIEEISVTRHDRPVRVVHRRFSEYKFMETNIVYESEDRLQAFIRRMAQFGGTTVSLAQPSLEVVLQGASDLRVSASLGDEISRPGSTYSIRKQKENPLTIVQLAAPQLVQFPAAPTSDEPFQPGAYGESTYHKTLSALMAAYFWLFLERTTNVLVCGETSSGKTTLMNAVLSMMDPRAKIVTAEDVPEISLSSDLHWQRMKTRARRAGLSPTTGGYEYALSDLLRLALRFSPTILSLGEMRGEESETVATAITLGFSTITTVHAEDAERCVQRVTTPPMRFQEGHVRDITAIATMRKILLPDGSTARRVVSVDEVRPVGHDSHEIVNVFRYNFAADCFFPATPEEVLERSFRLKEMAEGLGWTNERILGSLTRRAAYISKTVADGGFSPSDLSAMVRSYMVKEVPRELERMAS